MLKIRHAFIALGMLLSSAASADVQVSIGIGLPHVSIGINLSTYPQLVRVPGYPVYYAPQLEANFFFYDSMYWVYQDDSWYASSWYNGPWWLVDPEAVPVFVLRIPVRYYLLPPPYFRGWLSDAPPRWGDHWGREWEQHRSGWDRWNHRAAPAPAPLPVYQRQYSGNQYPRQVEQQQVLQQQHYRYQPRDPIVRQHYQEQAVQRAPAQQEKRGETEPRYTPQQDRPTTQRSQSPQKRSEEAQRPIPSLPQQNRQETQDHRQRVQPEPIQREQQIQKSQDREERQQDRDTAREPQRKGQGQERERDRHE